MSKIIGYSAEHVAKVKEQKKALAAKVEALAARHQPWVKRPLTNVGVDYGSRSATPAVYSYPISSPGPALTGAMPAISFNSTKPRPIPREGIRAGEITTWRLWRLVKFGRAHLISLAVPVAWNPKEPMEGDVNGGYGVFSFKTKDMAGVRGYMESFAGWHYSTVLGSVEIWGEVVEHESGYRSQYASIKSLDYIFGNEHRISLTDLRTIYGV